MRVGLLYDFANPAPWRRDDAELYAYELDQITRAEALGIDNVWVTEHHFVDSYICSPLVAMAAVAARTSRIRIGSAILVTPLYHPVRLAEDLAIIDVISNGRVEVGLGLGWSVDEYRCFDVELGTQLSRTKEVLDVVRLAWVEDEFTYEGRHFRFGPTRVLPKPVQRPHPRVWTGATSPEGARRAGRWGLPLMWIDRGMAQVYLDAHRGAGHDPATVEIDGYINLFVCDDPERLWARARDHYVYQAARNTGRDAAAPGATIVQRPVATIADVEAARASGAILFVTPEQAVDELRRRTHGLPVTGFLCHNRVCGMPDELSERHIELLATVVRPALADDRK
jgi:alkanesulfonate monooxygenase SsuD/methylene tetrahydromethanopterin reductase-like flavin-dependent oxidoreductase (luciferase family)